MRALSDKWLGWDRWLDGAMPEAAAAGWRSGRHPGTMDFLGQMCRITSWVDSDPAFAVLGESVPDKSAWAVGQGYGAISKRGRSIA